MILSLFRMTVCKNQKSFPLVTKLKHKLLENDVFFLAVEHDRYNDFDTVVIKTRSGVNIKKNIQFQLNIKSATPVLLEYIIIHEY